MENAIVSFMLFKVVSKSMEAAADRVAGVLGDLLVEEEERSKVQGKETHPPTHSSSSSFTH